MISIWPFLGGTVNEPLWVSAVSAFIHAGAKRTFNEHLDEDDITEEHEAWNLFFFIKCVYFVTEDDLTDDLSTEAMQSCPFARRLDSSPSEQFFLTWGLTWDLAEKSKKIYRMFLVKMMFPAIIMILRFPGFSKFSENLHDRKWEFQKVYIKNLTCSPMTFCPALSCSSVNSRLFPSPCLTPMTGPANPDFCACPPSL